MFQNIFINFQERRKISDYSPSFTRTSFPGGFLGDIALPNVRYEMEWDLQKANKSYIDEIEKYRKEVLHEGLQVEEEGLVGIHHKKLAGTSSSRQNGTLGILKEGQERARNRIIPKPKNKTVVAATIAEEITEAKPVLLTTTLKPVAFSTETTRRLAREEESTTTTTSTSASPAATDSVDSSKPTQKKKSENRNRRPHRQRKNKNRRRKNRRRKKQKQE